MKKYCYLFLLAVTLPIQLSGQWALWSNPSLPVGSSDQGVGLGAGDIIRVVGDVNHLECFLSVLEVS